MRRLLLALALLSLPALAAGQALPAPAAPAWAPSSAVQVPPIANPSALSFTPSSAHAQTAGTPPVNVMSNYKVEILSGATVVRTADLGMPAVVGGLITYTGIPALRGNLADGTYVARVWAEGPGGRNVTPNSDPFLWATAPVLPPAPPAPGKPTWVR